MLRILIIVLRGLLLMQTPFLVHLFSLHITRWIGACRPYHVKWLFFNLESRATALLKELIDWRVQMQRVRHDTRNLGLCPSSTLSSWLIGLNGASINKKHFLYYINNMMIFSDNLTPTSIKGSLSEPCDSFDRKLF